MPPTIHVSAQKSWQNWHRTVKQPVKRLLDVWNAQPEVSDLDTYKDTTAGLQQLIRQAVKEGVTLRALGGGWSFSPVAAADGILINTRPLNYRFKVGPQAHPQYGGDPTGLLFVQCGMSIAELNDFLKAEGRSIRTAGASNGQTIAGAMSTGTHGAAIDVGAVQDYVVGLHLIVGPDRHVWLERASAPAIADGVPQRLGAELIRDDALFDAARVCFGSFGIVHGVVIETDPLFYLQATRRRLPLNDALWAVVDGLDFTRVPLPRPAADRPYHFQVVINPHEAANVWMTVMYKDAQRRPDCKPPTPGSKVTQGDNALEVMGAITDLASDVTPFVVTELMKRVYPPYEGVCGTFGEIFTDTTTRGQAASTAMGVPLGQVRKACEIVFRLNHEYPFPGLVALRYVKASKATLAFTLHGPQTCVLELDGPWSARTRTFYRKVWRAFDAEGIPYTFHWGKLNDLDATRVRAQYGAQRVDAWRAARKALLDTPKLRKTFANQVLRDMGLDT